MKSCHNIKLMLKLWIFNITVSIFAHQSYISSLMFSTAVSISMSVYDVLFSFVSLAECLCSPDHYRNTGVPGGGCARPRCFVQWRCQQENHVLQDFSNTVDCGRYALYEHHNKTCLLHLGLLLECITTLHNYAVLGYITRWCSMKINHYFACLFVS